MPQLKRPTSRYAPKPAPPPLTDYETITVRRLNYTLETGIERTFAIEEGNPDHKFSVDKDGNTWIEIDGFRAEIPKSRVIYSESYPDKIQRRVKITP